MHLEHMPPAILSSPSRPRVLVDPNDYFIIQKGNEIIGTVARQIVLSNATGESGNTTLSEIADPVVKILSPGTSLENAYTWMLETTAEVLVVSDLNMLPGIITRKSIMEYVSMVKSERKYGKSIPNRDPFNLSPS